MKGFCGIGDLLEHGVGELAVDLLVVLPILGTKDRACMGDVAKGPQALVGEAKVVAVFFLTVEPYAAKRVLRFGRRHAQAIVFVHGFAVRVAAGLRDPGPVARPQDRLEGGHQAAGRDHNFEIAVLAGVNVRLAIGNHHQPPVLQPLADVHGKPVGGPQRLRGLPQAGFARSRGAGFLQRLDHVLHLSGQRTEQFASRGGDFRLSAAEGLQPLRRLADRAHEAPANDQKGDQHDQQNFQRDVNQRLPPNYGVLFADEARVVKDGQAHGFAVGTAHGEHLRVVEPGAEREKDPLPIGILGIDLGRQDGKRVFQGDGKALGHRDAFAGIVENCRSHDALAGAEAIQRAAQLQRGGVLIEQRLQVVDQALGGETGALIEFRVERPFLVLFLVIGE